MEAKVFKKDDWQGILDELRASYRVYVPVKEKGYHIFRALDNGTRADFNFQNTRLSPKSIVYPQSERMFEYSLDESDPDAHILKEAEKEYPPQLIMGIRPCDAYAFQLVKLNFDTPEYKDPWWIRRFQSTTFVGLGCNEPESTCFCTSVADGPFGKKGLDALIYDLGEKLLFVAITEKGEKLLKGIRRGEAADDAILREAQELEKRAEKAIVSHVPTDKLKDKKVTELFDAPFWKEISFACINCGTCTYLCPTCWCFDIQDEVYGKRGDRIRNWDSCMFPLFTLHGSGHNPRAEKYQRVRQRFMHKLKYFVDKYENGVQCVGCGRCVQFCPVNIDIREIFKIMNEF